MDYRQQGQGQGQFFPGFPGGGFPGGGFPGGGGNVDRRLDQLERQMRRVENRLESLERRTERIERRLGMGSGRPEYDTYGYYY
ncbi:hypothetical protein M3182_19585 [Mesobacillus maritimus]|nr:hypothetical protein [Mesobacillus maritimus]MCM3587931.1 hypothetical protein [Mesobacillus maritimus]MCM3670105.1 hypothetical protein [Mesobacillus maritimus]